MNVEYHKWYSPHLGGTMHGADMELKWYGHAGKPFIVFPCQGGRFYEWEDFGMLEACAAWLEEGRLQLCTVDSIDNESWCNWNAHPVERARRHDDYDHYIIHEVAPFARGRGWQGKLGTVGASMGGYHASNFFFRHPDVFDTVVSLSGLLQLRMFVGDCLEDAIYYNTPLAYLPNMSDPWFLDQYRQSQIIICAGQGSWDEEMVGDARAIQRVLEAKAVPCWVDVWGHDVSHDWPWWRRQWPYFLGNLGL
jgi:esterase/lipase superfamily enzyme